jgi:hypothetical protein
VTVLVGQTLLSAHLEELCADVGQRPYGVALKKVRPPLRSLIDNKKRVPKGSENLACTWSINETNNEIRGRPNKRLTALNDTYVSNNSVVTQVFQGLFVPWAIVRGQC